MTDPVRRDALIRLLEQLHTGLPETGVARPLSTAGFVHDIRARETCPDCFGDAPERFGCETCGGRGYLEQRRRKDPYDLGGVMLAFGGNEREASKRRDQEIATLERQLEPPKTEADQQAEANQHPEPWELDRRDLYRDYDYPALDRALERLRDRDGDAYRAVFACHVYGWMPQEGLAAALAERGLEQLDGWMPTPIRAPKRREAVTAEDRSIAARDIRIREAFAAGTTVKRLAKEHELSVSTVNRIVFDLREGA